MTQRQETGEPSREMHGLLLDPAEVSADGAWLFWAEEPGEPFLHSLVEAGQLEPILVSRDAGRWTLITGYKRLSACRRMARLVWARAVEAGPEERGRIAFCANWPRRLEPPECLPPARYFQSVCPAERLRSLLEELLAGLVGRRCLEDLWAWLCLPEGLDCHALAGRIPLESGHILATFRREDLLRLEPFFAGLSWSRSRARQFLTWLKETALREETSVGDVLDRAGLDSVLEEDLSPKDRLQKLLAAARALRYPVLSQLEEEFKRIQGRLRRTTVWRLEAEQGFETNRLSLCTRLSGPQELQRAARDLQSLAEQGDLEGIFRWQAERLDGERPAPGSAPRGPEEA